MLPVGQEALFAFHESPAALGKLMARRPGFRVVSHDGHVGPGAVVTIADRVLGIPFQMTFRHTLLEPPTKFAEEMIQGPFARFAHSHHFAPAGEGEGTRMTDVLEFSLPWWLGGELACALVVAPLLRSSFAWRHRELARLAAARELQV